MRGWDSLRAVGRIILCLTILFLGPLAAMAQTNASQLIEAAGLVELRRNASTNWSPATTGTALNPGDCVRTRDRSRAAVQLSDRSVIRLSERTTLELLPPRNAEKKRFGLPSGALYFFNREKPADVEFDTPLATGAIRGTEFLLEAADDRNVHLALIDGLVSLDSKDGEVSMQRGEDVRLAQGQPPQRTALVNATAQIQWALYYPAVVVPSDLDAAECQRGVPPGVLEKYLAGDLLGALADWPDSLPTTGTSPRILRAQLELAVGRAAVAEQLLAGLPETSAGAALQELIATVRNEPPTCSTAASTASCLLARSYTLQQKADLEGARAAAHEATRLAPDFGSAHARLAELEFAFGERREALAELQLTAARSPRLASAQSLQGFILLDQGDAHAALSQFEAARKLDAALGSAWLGRGLCLMHQRDFATARASLQIAAALEPQRGLFRSYLGKAASELGDAKGAEKEYRLAKELDPKDPTAWLYSALHLWQQNRLNAAIRDLEQSADRNDNRSAFRSRLMLDSDRAVRSANLAALYTDAGLSEASSRTAARSVAESYANFSGHLFLANSLQAQENANRYDLRFESARQSELLVANLLAPPGAGNLSQVLSQQEQLRFFEPRPVGLSLLTEYRSTGDFAQTATSFGTVGGLSYALDLYYEDLAGQQPNSDATRKKVIFTAKQRVTADDELYLQIGHYRSDAGDVSSRYDPAAAHVGFDIQEDQSPSLYLGWHHAWSPGNHTLVLFSRLDDSLNLFDPPSTNRPFVHQSFGIPLALENLPTPFSLDYHSDVTLYSGEIQQILETPKQSLVLGGRVQAEMMDVHAHLQPTLPAPPGPQDISGDATRLSVYGYYTWKPTTSLQLIGGVSYDHLEFPENTDFPPVSSQSTTRDQVSPKLGLLFAPWQRGLLRATYTRSLGGVFFDNDVRLEPTQVGGFNQAWRSIIPESAAGPLAGAEFETKGVGFDQSLASGTWFGLEALWLDSNGHRTVGALSNSIGFLAIPDSPTSLHEDLDFHEFTFAAYAAQLLGDHFTAGARYRISEARLNTAYNDFPAGFPGAAQAEQHARATLQQISLTLGFSHPCGAFGEWESAWYHQSNDGYAPALAGDEFWQHNLTVGWRFHRRMAEVKIGVLNLFGDDYRLNPLNLHADLPRERTFAASLRLNF